MMLVKDLATVRKHLPTQTTFQFPRLEPHLQAAQRDLVRNVLGYDLVKRLSEFVAPAEPTEEDVLTEQLQQMAQRACVLIAFGAYLPWAQVNIDANGVFIASTDNMKTAFQWQINALLQQLKQDASAAIDEMLKLLNDHRTEFPTWAISPAGKKCWAQLVNTAQLFNSYVPAVSDRQTFEALLVYQEAANRQLQKALGATLFTEVIEGVKAANVLHPELTSMAQAFCCYYAYATGIGAITAAAEVAKIGKKETSDGITSIRQADWTQQREHFADRANAELQLIREYLTANAADYPSWSTEVAPTTSYRPQDGKFFSFM